MKDQFVQTARGRLHYLESGTGDPLILLHTNGASAHQFDAIAGDLARSFRVISLDAPGHGDSYRITQHHSIQQHTDIVVGFMDALDFKKAWVLGVSLGGFICVDLGARYASRVHGVIISEAAFRSEAEWQMNWGLVEKTFGEAAQSFDQVAPRLRALTPEVLERWNVDRNKAGVWTMIDVMWAIRQFDMAASVSKIKEPAALVFGDHGPGHEGLPRFKDALPGAPVHVLANCGHFPMIDDPTGFVAATVAFIQGASRE